MRSSVCGTPHAGRVGRKVFGRAIKMISLKVRVTPWRLTLTVLMLSLVGLTALTAPKWQDDEEDGERRLWNKQFLAARAKAKGTGGPSAAKGQTPGAHTRTTAQTKA